MSEAISLIALLNYYANSVSPPLRMLNSFRVPRTFGSLPVHLQFFATLHKAGSGPIVSAEIYLLVLIRNDWKLKRKKRIAAHNAPIELFLTVPPGLVG